MNQVLRTQDHDYLYMFRSFIIELHNQLTELYNSRPQLPLSPIYRGNVLPSSVIQNLKENIKGLVSMDTFLSATTNQQISDIFCGKGDSISPDCERVSFKFNINPSIKSKPYASIAKHSAVEHEDEILFSIGPVFRIKSFNEDRQNEILNFELDLTEEKNQRSVELTDYLKKRIGETPTLLTLGDFLCEIEEIPKDDERRAMIYNSLGCLMYEMKNIGAAQNYFEQAIEIMNIINSNYQLIILTRCNYEMAYFDSPLHPATSHAEAIELLTQATSAKYFESQILNNIGRLYYKKFDYPNAMEKFNQALDLLNELKVRYPPDLSAIHNNIGLVHFKTKQYTDALGKFQLAIDIGLEYWSPEHRWINEYKKNKATAEKCLTTNSKT
ncbi:unnamed protein product [Didymodactylos carnosus]|uniref:Tetratricopeptide repeat protein n=1 Tax=Didymodactylos carnosus TaxID=1234261 RepID=A0A8S2R4W9_9BILA|nr:unnamed protein product [Didymodactylos carnosus]CAF4139293.1 unnamed protein product [Didymodactylos carnosus]